MQNLASRREFARMIAAGLGLTALRGLNPVECESLAAPADPLTRARAILRATILEHAKAKDNPALLIHGIRAIGPGFSVEDGTAVEHLCSHYLVEKRVNGKVCLYMPIGNEGHVNAFLSDGALDAGVTLDYSFRWNGRRRTIGEVVAGAKDLFVFDPTSFDRDSLAWSLLVFARTTVPRQDRWTNAYGTPIRFSDVVESGMVTLETATQQIRTAMRRGSTTPEADTIHDFACAGTHLIYGLTTCLRFGHTQRGIPERMKEQFDLLVWRLGADSQLIDRYYQQAARQYSQDLVRLYRRDAKLKFLGHAFEIISYARLFRLFYPTPVQQEAISRGQRELVGIVEDLGKDGVVKLTKDQELFNLTLSDACHAYHGLAMIKGVNQA